MKIKKQYSLNILHLSNNLSFFHLQYMKYEELFKTVILTTDIYTMLHKIDGG